MTRISKTEQPFSVVMRYGADIISSSGMQLEKTFIQHGATTVYAHSVSVACMCVRIAQKLGIPTNARALVRGALLHDYFLYDWHKAHPDNKWHGFTHPNTAMRKASRDFDLSDRERDMISKHMFPLTLKPPMHRESFILCIADKIIALRETIADRLPRKK